ncbi:DUF2232 domain-containing protein [Neobacillus pocheonensis]|uniref:YybS family protein n=1 Tax=Neobacillus pocheonensis TaxID=363869 RepID=UPI003D2BEB37
MRNVRKLTEGAILLAAFTVLLILTIYVPFLNSILIFVLPLPFLMFSAKSTMKNIAAFFLAALFISYIAGSFMGLGLMLLFGATGVVIGYSLQVNKSRTAILISSTLTFMAGLVVFYVILNAFLKIDIMDKFNVAFKMSSKDRKMLDTLVPYFLVMCSIIYTYIIQWVCLPIAKKFGVKVQPWESFRNLSLPRSLLWYYLISIGLNLVMHPKEGTYVYTALINLRYILEMFLFFQGLAFLVYILQQRSVAKGLVVLAAILTFMIPTFHYIIMLLGITDIGFDFRKRFAKKE